MSASSSKIVARLFGGLGNQLFIYAAARRLALVNGGELVIDDVSGFTADYRYRRQCQLQHFRALYRSATAAERLEPLSKLRRHLLRSINARRQFDHRNYIYQASNGFEPRLLTLKPRGVLHVEGYWQSEKYFEDIENVIRSELAMIPPVTAQNLSLAEKIRSELAVAVHFRSFQRTDPLAVNLPATYYSNAVKMMMQTLPRAHYFVFSDDPIAAKACVSVPEECVTFICHNRGDDCAFADMWLMSLCKHFIIANSTFSWWGAWLGSKAGKHVIAPNYLKEHGASAWGFSGLIPDAWQLVDI
jgi:hypothetical protein